MEKSEKIYEKRLRTILWHNFLAGVAWGLGITVGATIFLAIGGFLLSKINLIPIIGTFVVQIVEFVQYNSGNL